MKHLFAVISLLVIASSLFLPAGAALSADASPQTAVSAPWVWPLPPENPESGISRPLSLPRTWALPREKRYNLRRMVVYGRIPGYNDYAGKMTAEEYVEKIIAGEMTDPSLTAHLRAGYNVRRVLLDFLWDDSSLNYSTLLDMPNTGYQPEKRKIAAAPLQRVVRRIRVCAAQWFMRPIHSWDEFEHTVNFYVDTADTYHSHFLIFPELFTAQLFTIMPADLDSRAAIRRLASMTDRYIDLFSTLALNI